jgi:hypothetical protein
MPGLYQEDVRVLSQQIACQPCLQGARDHLALLFAACRVAVPGSGHMTNPSVVKVPK